MTTSEASPSLHLRCLKNCLLPENLAGDCSLENKIISDTSSSSSLDPSKSPTNNNNNNNTTTSNSNPVHLNHKKCAPESGSGGQNCLSSVQASTVYGTLSSPCLINSTHTSVSNACCAQNQVVSLNNCKSVCSGPELERDSGKTQDCCSSLKITENHLSTKVLRNKSAPYSIPNSSGTAAGVSTSSNRTQNQDKSNHSPVNPSASVNGGSTGSFIASCDEDQAMFDNVSVNSLDKSGIHEHNVNNHNLMGSTSLMTSGISGSGVNSNGVIHPNPNNMVIKTEPNGNSIELTLDNQFHNHVHHFQHQHQSNGSNSDCLSHSPLSGDSIGNMQPHDSFLGALNAQHSNSNQHCHNGLFVNPCAHNCGSMGSISGNSNGAGSMASPGTSLDEHDCDDDKVINGDTFATGDLPDPDAIKMFVGQCPKHLNEPELRTLFEEFGRVFQINVLRDKVTKQSKGCCFVTFYTRKSALDAQNALHNVKTLPGMNHPLQMKPADNENRYERKLFVGMISRKCNEADVRTMFSRFGVIDECTVLRDASQQSKGCAFVTFASKQSAQTAIKAVHHSTTMEGCSSPVVVKFADTQKDKDQKRQQTFTSTLMGNLSATAVAPLSQPQPVFTGLLKLEQILQQLQQAAQPQTGYYSQLSPLGVGLGGGLGSNSGGNFGGLGSSPSNSEWATIAALALNPNLNPANQHHLTLATLAALGNHSSLSPTGANNGGSLGSSNALSLAGNGIQSGLSSFPGAIRSQTVANKQSEGPEGANLFIYHLPMECGDLDLAQMFATFGNVISAKVFVDKVTNLSKCFGFVSYDSPLSAQLAIQQMHGYQIGMKRLKVQLKRPKDAAKPY